jgi:uncharacterized membrane protein
MKILNYIVLSLLSIGVLSPSVFAYYTEDWEITNFQSNISFNDGEVFITETIDVDFTKEEHRGIERSILYKYDNNRDSGFNFIKASNPYGEDWVVKTFDENGNYYIQMTSTDDLPFAAPATFQVEYSLDNAVNFFQSHDELYWNVTGTDWVVKNKKAKATITLPEEFTQDQISVECFVGTYGTKENVCESEFIAPSTIEFSTTTSLDEYEGLSFVLGLPAGTLEKPAGFENTTADQTDTSVDSLEDSFEKYRPQKRGPIGQALYFIQDFIEEAGGFLLAPLVFFFMFITYLKKGRDDKTVADTVIPHYVPPKGLSPCEVGCIIDEKLDPKDITSTIIRYAVKGNIRIKELEKKKLLGKSKDYQLEIIKPYKNIPSHESQVLDRIFFKNEAGEKIKISKLKNRFYEHVDRIRINIFKDLIRKGYFPHDPHSVRKTYLYVGSAIFILSMQIIGILQSAWGIGLIVSGLIIAGFSKFMPRKTKKGTEVYYKLKGLYEYIDTAEKDRLKFQEDNLIMFERLLPYAIAFGLAKKWAKAFDGILTQSPSWFIGSNFNDNFSMFNLANALDNFSDKTVKDITSKPQGSSGGSGSGSWGGSSGFGGGGFSGGGFGGGGGRGL